MSEINLSQKPIPYLIDAHQDLAWNMLTFNRDYTLSASQIRAAEKSTNTIAVSGDTTLGWLEYRQANTAIIFNTLFAGPIHTKEGVWDTQTYSTPDQSSVLYHRQMDAYDRLTDEHPDKFRLLRSKKDVRNLLSEQEQNPDAPIGLLTLMEGADGIKHPKDLPEWVERGVRLIGLAWQATRYSGGTKEPGPLTRDGIELLKQMEENQCILDISHMDEQAVWQALDRFHGPVMASHAPPLSMLRERNSNRFISDDVIRAIAERNGVIGLVTLNIFLDKSWMKGDEKSLVPLHRLVEQMDYICQLLGTSKHVGIGSDLDGGHGYLETPAELSTIADLPKIIPMLEQIGYSNEDITGIYGKNWSRFILEVLP